ncbi:MAG: hypothetical protein HC789_03410 [Microcoleus sp. CSU_2_2]|nr:hypothetical protein [Microcoleus sp. SU_5_3]NJS09481.1 hypothetical protein [Microcoleus sp. CSU_2_2]
MCVYLGFGLLILPGFDGKILRQNINSDSLRDSFARPDLTEGTPELDSFSLTVKLYLRQNPKFLLDVVEVAGADLSVEINLKSKI